MSDISTVDGLREYRGSLTGELLSDYQLVLLEIGNYFLLTIPSDIDDEYVLEVEALLNDLKVTSFRERWNVADRDAIIFCLNKASSLSDIVKRGAGGARGEEFFNQANYLGLSLISVGES